MAEDLLQHFWARVFATRGNPRRSARTACTSSGRTSRRAPGTRRATGAAAAHYYARLASSTDTTDVNNIITNSNFSGPNTVNLSGTYALEISVGCTCYRVNS
jgi:hypothetical protein